MTLLYLAFRPVVIKARYLLLQECVSNFLMKLWRFCLLSACVDQIKTTQTLDNVRHSPKYRHSIGIFIAREKPVFLPYSVFYGYGTVRVPLLYGIEIYKGTNTCFTDFNMRFAGNFRMFWIKPVSFFIFLRYRDVQTPNPLHDTARSTRCFPRRILNWTHIWCDQQGSKIRRLYESSQEWDVLSVLEYGGGYFVDCVESFEICLVSVKSAINDFNFVVPLVYSEIMYI